MLRACHICPRWKLTILATPIINSCMLYISVTLHVVTTPAKLLPIVWACNHFRSVRYNDVMMGTMASQTTRLTNFYSTVYSGSDQRKHQSSASLAFVRGIHRWPVNSLHKGPVTRKMFPFDDVITSLRKSKMSPWCSWQTALYWARMN